SVTNRFNALNCSSVVVYLLASIITCCKPCKTFFCVLFCTVYSTIKLFSAVLAQAEALEDMLDGDEDNRIQLEKKASVIPRCDVGERCALKHGPRIGRLCDCMRGTACNTFFLRCY
uniref:Cocaine- and amphetamine-regulated transcript 4 n=1 Tax=Astyanax mexicanus TaxID=7994 RepID=A0A3B1K7H4_ASTMX